MGFLSGNFLQPLHTMHKQAYNIKLRINNLQDRYIIHVPNFRQYGLLVICYPADVNCLIMDRINNQKIIWKVLKYTAKNFQPLQTTATGLNNDTISIFEARSCKVACAFCVCV